MKNIYEFGIAANERFLINFYLEEIGYDTACDHAANFLNLSQSHP